MLGLKRSNKVKCIAKIVESHKITGYKIRDQKGNVNIIKPALLKLAIRLKQIDVTNLRLTQDNRLIKYNFDN